MIKIVLQVGDRVVFTNARTQASEFGTISSLDARLADVSVFIYQKLVDTIYVQGTVIANVQRDAGGIIKVP